MSDLETVPRSEDVVAEPRLGRRKAKALLAGGLVLGMGAAITLAAWNDSEFAGGPFASGRFNLEGSTNGADFSDHEAPTQEEAALLSFTLDPTNLSPGAVTYAPFALRLDAATTSDATVAVSSVGMPPAVFIDNLTYELIQTAAFGCSEETEATATLVPADTPLNVVNTPASFPLTHGSGGEPGAEAFLCFKVTAEEDLAQGQAGGAGWEFRATSQ